MKRIFGYPFFGITPTLLSIVSKVCAPFLKSYESSAIKNVDVSEFPEHLNPVFIVGAPRCGSTFCYQAITNHFDLLYPNNLIAHLYRTPFSAFRISNYLFGNKAHNSFTSQHGRTYHEGMHAPNEFTGFWYRWFPMEQDFVDIGELDQKFINEIRETIFAISKKNNKPIVFKNLYNGQRLRAIHEIFPNARIVFISRIAEDNVNSILQARKRDGTNAKEWWSVKPKNWKEINKLQDPQRTLEQVKAIELEIKTAGKLFDGYQFLEINYEHFRETPDVFLRDISQSFFKGKVEIRKDAAAIQVNKTAN